MCLCVWAASALGFLIVFVAPGNFVRMKTWYYRWDYLMFIKHLLRNIHPYILPWCLDFKHWLLALILWLDPRVACVRVKFAGMSSSRAIGGFALVWLLSIILMVGAALYLAGGGPPARTMDFIYGVFLIGWITLAFLLIRPHTRFSLHPAHRVTALSSALFLLSMLVATSNNTVFRPLLKNEWVRLKFGPLLFIDRMVSNDAASYALVKAEAAAGGGQRPAFTRA
jgi:hypothetical protein